MYSGEIRFWINKMKSPHSLGIYSLGMTSVTHIHSYHVDEFSSHTYFYAGDDGYLLFILSN